jgi:hypothetical protein
LEAALHDGAFAGDFFFFDAQWRFGVGVLPGVGAQQDAFGVNESALTVGFGAEQGAALELHDRIGGGGGCIGGDGNEGDPLLGD